MAPLKGLGQPPEWSKKESVADLLEPVYRSVGKLSLEIALGERKTEPALADNGAGPREKGSEPAPKPAHRQGGLLGSRSPAEGNGQAPAEAAKASHQAVLEELAGLILERAVGRKMIRMADLEEWTRAEEPDLRQAIDQLIARGKLAPRGKGLAARSFSVVVEPE
jgi:hypothetical protein